MTFIFLEMAMFRMLKNYFSCSVGIYFVFVPVISIYVYLTVE